MIHIKLTDTESHNASHLAEILQLNIERSRLNLGPDPRSSGQLTVSIGVTEYVYGEDTEILIKRADDALYQSKRNGRNRICHIAPPR